MMREARAELIDQAVKDGKITEEQANWMKNRGMRMMQRWQEFRGNYGPQNNP
jgi:polyhydroxyalkanoate synthesis regulator phasin